MMVCSGTLAPDPSACDVRRGGDVVANALWRSQDSQAAEFRRPSPSFRPTYEPKTIDHGESRVLSAMVKRY